VKELKALLAASGLDIGGCVEKADLEALLRSFETTRQRPLEELQESCAAGGGGRPATKDECARYLLSSGLGRRRPTTAPTPSPTASTKVPEDASATSSARNGNLAVEEEVNQLLLLRRDGFPDAAAWGFAFLRVQTQDVATVQQRYRAMMRMLHPDKVGHLPRVAKAVELLREAKELCERKLSRTVAPGQPRDLGSTTLCSEPGRRRYKLQWLAPEERDGAPVHRYVVSVVDPAYGRALTVTVLEPDYSEELRRYIPIAELGSYVLAEEELQKMPSVFQQKVATVQVVAANDAGQSASATVKVPLTVALPAKSLLAEMHAPNVIGSASTKMSSAHAAALQRILGGQQQASPSPTGRDNKRAAAPKAKATAVANALKPQAKAKKARTLGMARRCGLL